MSSPNVVLESIPFLRKLTGSIGIAREWPGSTSLITAGSEPGGIIWIESGRVLITTMKQAVLEIQVPTVIGEMSYLTRNPAIASVHLPEGGRGHVVSTAALEALARTNASTGHELYQRLTRISLSRLMFGYHEPYLVLIAHDGCKEQLCGLVEKYQSMFRHFPLVSTKHTAAILYERLGIQIDRQVNSGRSGGDLEVGSLVSQGRIKAVFFLRDPMCVQPHQADVSALIRICEVYNIPIATNLSTAHIVARALSSSPDREHNLV